jgi:hypothetical protein
MGYSARRSEDKQNPVMGRPPDMPDFTIAHQQITTERALSGSARTAGSGLRLVHGSASKARRKSPRETNGNGCTSPVTMRWRLMENG